MLKLHDIGQAVTGLQRLLGVPATAVYDEATQLAVSDAQRRFGLVVDGIAGPKTMEALTRGIRPARLLGDADLKAAAEVLGVPIAAVRAVNQVESRGSGYLADGRPVILFERHVFFRELEKAGVDAQAIASKYPTLCAHERGGYSGGSAEWTRMELAASVSYHREAALRSASWGLFQIMGYHASALGYASAQDFAADMALSEGQQLQAFVRFIKADSALHKALKALKWAEFARIYNGPAYRDNAYDLKLARAFERFKASDPSDTKTQA